MSDTITLTGDYGYKSYRVSGLAAGTTIDASTASWIQDNSAGDGSSNAYPFLVYDAPKAVLDGGTINGHIDLTKDWRTVYDMGNSAGVRTEDAPDVVIRDWQISNTWDAVRVSWNSPNFLIEDVHVTNARDDAVENDRLNSGTIRDSLFDGVFSGISLDPDSSNPVDGHTQTVTLDGVLMRMKSFLYEGEMTHESMIKTDSATNGTVTPHLRFIDTVFAIEDVNHHSYRSMVDAWAHTVESHGNVFLNLSDDPLPANYPKPPAGWTILQGQAARDYWENAKDTWIANHDGSVTPPPPDDDGATEAPPPPPSSGPDTSNPNVFVFEQAPSDTNVKHITGFVAADDALYFDNSVFTSLGPTGSPSSPQPMTDSNFELRPNATGGNDYILYDRPTGQLFYDADGSGSGAKVLIAQFEPNTVVNYHDAFVI